jgi:uncharacterized phage-like protein YoqJ
MIIALTGHREQRLNLPADVTADKWCGIRHWIRQDIINNKADEVFSGLASGSDMAMAYEAARLKDEGHKLKLTLVLPCPDYGMRTPNYEYVYRRANKIVNIYDHWFKGCDEGRDDYMAKNCDIMLAIFDGNKTGGVWSTMNKAHNYNKTVRCCPLNLYLYGELNK